MVRPLSLAPLARVSLPPQHSMQHYASATALERAWRDWQLALAAAPHLDAVSRRAGLARAHVSDGS